MKDIEKFKPLYYYKNVGEKLTPEEAKKLGLEPEFYLSLEECAYQVAYDISNDWTKEVPEWKDVQEGYRRGAEDGIAYAERVLTDVFKRITKGTGLFKDDEQRNNLRT